MSKAIMRPGVHHYYSKSFTKGKKEKENVSSLLAGTQWRKPDFDACLQQRLRLLCAFLQPISAILKITLWIE